MKTLRGIAASRGIVAGPVFHFRRAEIKIERRQAADPSAECARFFSALSVAKSELELVYDKAKAETGEKNAEIFEAHQMLLEDPELLTAVTNLIEQQSINSEAALKEAAEMYATTLEAMENEYFQARAADVRDVTNRVLRILQGLTESPAANLKAPSIILADDLMPSDTALLDKTLVLGFCSAAGGATSHTAILARSLGIPAVVSAGMGVMEIREQDQVILDGSSGALVVEPDQATLQAYLARQEGLKASFEKAQASSFLPAVTLDGYTVEVAANIGNLEDARAAVRYGAEGVGLFRTEFLYLEQNSLPDEETQHRAYAQILEPFEDHPVILRTLDIGGDKELPYLKLDPEMNPFLGCRAIRLCLARPELFKPQLRAALRAGAGHNLKLMFPMIATAGEVRAARGIFEECQAELAREGIPFAENMEVGIMIEIPAAAVMANRLAKEVDFFSIGTNDLSQYTMAADRTNGAVAGLTSSFQPAVLRLVKMVIDAGHAQDKRVGMCGEMAGEPLAIPLLVGLGLDDFSMAPTSIPIAKEIIRALSKTEMEALIDEALELESPEEVQRLVKNCCPWIEQGAPG